MNNQKTLHLTVLASGNGSNFQKIIEAIKTQELNAKILKLIVDKPCFAIERAQNNSIETSILKRDKQLSINILKEIPAETDYIVLVGFLSILSSEICQKWSNKIINLHPSLLPKFGGKGMYGTHVHQAVLEANEQFSGATVHLVTSEIDKGKIIEQESCKIEPNETIETLQQKISKIEHKIIVKALQKLQTQHTNNQ